MSADEYRTHMSLWAILAAPLLAGNDLSTMTPDTIAMLTNRDVIAVDQDPLGKQGDRVSAEGPIEIWARPLADGSKAVGIFNRHPGQMSTTVDFHQLGFRRTVHVRDLWQGKDLGEMSNSWQVTLPAHGVVFVRIK
jgi:alpha-galactosidase